MSRKGENIFKRKDGRWEARYIHHYEDGKAKYRYLYGNSYAEVKARKQMELALPENRKAPVVKQLAAFDTLADLWLADIRISVKESTYTRYYRIVTKYLLPLLKDQQLSKIGQRQIRQLPEKLLAEGGVRNGALSPKTVSDILCVLKAIFRYGEENHYYCPDVNWVKYPPKTPRTTKLIKDADRIRLERKLLNSDDPVSLGILFTLFTGVRIGELCGLRWEDIDFSNGTVMVRRTVARIADLDPKTQTKTKVIISEPKTERSVRLIPLPDFLAEYLFLRKKEKNCYLVTGCPKYTEPHQYYMRYKKYLRENHMEAYTFHALRHTFATCCVEKGFDTKSLSEILGHSSITTTLSTYVHPSLQQKKVQMDRLMPACL